jgi:hypothetical protein
MARKISLAEENLCKFLTSRNTVSIFKAGYDFNKVEQWPLYMAKEGVGVMTAQEAEPQKFKDDMFVYLYDVHVKTETRMYLCKTHDGNWCPVKIQIKGKAAR